MTQTAYPPRAALSPGEMETEFFPDKPVVMSRGNAILRQLWKIKYLADGYYSIRSLYKADKCIQRTVGSTALLTVGPGDYVANFPSDALWKIESVGTGYLLQNCWTPAAKQCLKATASSTSVNTYSTGDSSFIWTLTADTSVQDMLLLIDTNTALPVTNPSKTIPNFRTATLEDLDLSISFISQTTNEQYAIGWESSNTSVVTVGAFSGNVTPHTTAGSVVIKATHPMANNTAQYTATFEEPEYVVNLDVICDEGFAERYNNSLVGRLTPQLYALQRIFWYEFGIHVDYSTPRPYQSVADLCQAGIDEACRCGECCNSYSTANGIVYHETNHHKNIYNIFYDIDLPNRTQTLRMAYTGHSSFCEVVKETVDGVVVEKCVPTRKVGLALQSLGIALVKDSGGDSACRTAIHEFGHLYGAKDHYGGEWPTTQEMNAQPDSGNLYNMNCIYGENKSALTVGEDNLFCEGCRRDIARYVDQYDHS